MKSLSTAWVSALRLWGGAGLQHSLIIETTQLHGPRNNTGKCLSVNRDRRGPCKRRLGCVWNTSPRFNNSHKDTSRAHLGWGNVKGKIPPAWWGRAVAPKSRNQSLLWCQTNVISWNQFARVIGSGHYCTWSKVTTGGISRGLLCPNAESWFNCMGNSVCTIETPAQYVIQRKPNYQWELHPDNTISTKRQLIRPIMSCWGVVFFQVLPIYFREASTVVSPAPRLPLLPRSRPVRRWTCVMTNKVHWSKRQKCSSTVTRIPLADPNCCSV